MSRPRRPLSSTVPKFPPSVGLDDQANVLLLGESMKRVLNADAIERSEDPIVQAKYRELARERQCNYTPARFPQTQSVGGTEPSVSSAGYTSFR